MSGVEEERRTDLRHAKSMNHLSPIYGGWEREKLAVLLETLQRKNTSTRIFEHRGAPNVRTVNYEISGLPPTVSHKHSHIGKYTIDVSQCSEGKEKKSSCFSSDIEM